MAASGLKKNCTYTFCSIAELKRIIILCLVAHTTHRCQPCDVGVFGPLAASWKSEVMMVARKSQKITKYNLLKHYTNARSKAFTASTIQASFRKTGIWPVDRTVPARLPSLLEPIDPALPSDTTLSDIPTRPNSPTSSPAGPSSLAGSSSTPSAAPAIPSASAALATPQYRLANFPRPLPPTVSRASLLERNRELENYAKAAKEQLEGDYASMKL